MKKHFVVAVKFRSKILEKRFSSLLQSNGCYWWHWIEGTWLLVDAAGKLTASAIRDEINKCQPGVQNIVLQVTPNTWAGRGPSSELNRNRNMFKWIRETWDK